MNRCEVCRVEVTANRSGCVERHRDTAGRICAASGQPYAVLTGVQL